MRKFTYSRSFRDEVYTAVEFDSFDEARRVVDKAIHDRELELSPVPDSNILRPLPGSTATTGAGLDALPNTPSVQLD